MEIGMDRVREYIVALMKAGDFSYEDAANLSGTPVQTVRNIATGKTPDPKFGTVAKIIIALGGDLNEIIGYEKKKEIEVNSTVSLKETYEMRITDMAKSYEMRIADMAKSYEDRIADIKAFSDQRVTDVQKCYELRLADVKSFYEERLAELRSASK